MCQEFETDREEDIPQRSVTFQMLKVLLCDINILFAHTQFVPGIFLIM